MRMNVNFLGEALLGEEEAERRLEAYLEALQLPEIEVLSVKISTIYSQISSLAFEAHGRGPLRPAGAALPRRGEDAASSAWTEPRFRSSSTWTWRSTAI